jgi:hypothetical protein
MNDSSPDFLPRDHHHPNPSSRPVSIARWVDSMIHRELTDPFTLDEARLYVTRADHGQQIFLLDSDEHPYRLLERTNDHPPVSAAALVVTGWCAPTAPDETMPGRPSEHPLRQRVRITVAIDADGIATVMRRDGAPDDPEVMEERGEGELPDALELWWRGELV